MQVERERERRGRDGHTQRLRYKEIINKRVYIYIYIYIKGERARERKRS